MLTRLLAAIGIRSFLLLSLFCLPTVAIRADAPRTIDKERLGKLVTLVFRPQPFSTDLRLIRTLRLDNNSKETVTAWVSKAYERPTVRRKFKTNEQFRDAVSIEVQRILDEQSVPRVLLQRIRVKGKQRRLDQTIVTQGVKPSSNDAEFDMSYVNYTGVTRKTGESYTYDWRSNIATLNRGQSAGWLVEDVIDLAFLPMQLRMLFFKLLSAPDLPLDQVRPGESELAIIQQGKHPEAEIRVHTDELHGRQVDVVGVYPTNAKQPALTVWVNAQNYQEWYRSEFRNPKSGLMVQLIEADSYFSQISFPGHIKSSMFLEDGSVKKEDEYVITAAQVDGEVADDVFEFHPPATWTAVDYSVSPPMVTIDGKPHPNLILPELSVGRSRWWYMLISFNIIAGIYCSVCFLRRRRSKNIT